MPRIRRARRSKAWPACRLDPSRAGATFRRVTAGQKRLLRVAALVVVVVALLLVGRSSGLASHGSVERVRALVVQAGPWGIALFVLVFSLGEMLHVPGLLFVAASVLAYGRLWGGLLGWTASLVAISVTFLMARAVAGTPLSEVKSPRMRRILEGLERRPVLTVFLLRSVFILSPPLTYALALSRVRYRDYLLGSAAGLAAPVGLSVVFFDALVSYVA